MADERFEVRLTPSAARELRDLPHGAQIRIARTIDRLAAAPRPRGAKDLTSGGPERIWRVRVGDHRILYSIQDDRLTVLVIAVGHRRGVYRPGERGLSPC